MTSRREPRGPEIHRPTKGNDIQKTTNYQLPKWEKTDRILMDDFNGMTAALAAKGNCRIQAGSYTGTWTWGEDGKNTIACSGVPLLLCVLAAAGEGVLLAAGNVARGQLLLGGSNYTMNMTWNSGSVQWYFNGNHT